MKCKLCQEEKGLIKAHIIPRAFYPSTDDPDETMYVLSSDKDDYPKKVRIGFYDQNILCAECEKKFNDWDTHGAYVLKHTTLHPVSLDGKFYFKGEYNQFFQIREFEYDKLKMFFVSLLWRAMASELPMFASVATSDEHMRRLSGYILDGTIPGVDEYSVIVSKYSQDAVQAHRSPIVRTMDGVRFQEFCFYGYVVYIKLSNRPVSESFAFYVLSPDRPLIVTGKDARTDGMIEVSRKLSKMHNWPKKRK